MKLILLFILGILVFNYSGTLGVNQEKTFDYPDDIFVQKDGKIIVVGRSQKTEKGVSHDRCVIVRYTKSGRLDAAFGRKGYQKLNFCGHVSVDLQGRIYVLSEFQEGLFVSLERVLANGKPDAHFGRSGRVNLKLDPSAFEGIGQAIALEPNGNILVLIQSFWREPAPETENTVQEQSPTTYGITEMVLLQNNGKLEPHFGKIGRVKINLEDSEYEDNYRLHQNKDQTISVIQLDHYHFNLTLNHFSKNGLALAKDLKYEFGIPSFYGATDFRKFNVNFDTRDQIIKTSHEWLIAGNTMNSYTPGTSTNQLILSRSRILQSDFENPSLILSENFAVAKVAETSSENSSDSTQWQALDSDNSSIQLILDTRASQRMNINGEENNPHHGAICLAKFRADNRLAWLSSEYQNPKPLKVLSQLEFFNKLIVQPDHKFIVLGTKNRDFGLLRFLPNGNLDSSFGKSGLVTTDFTNLK